MPESLQEEQFVAYLVHATMACGLIRKGLHQSVTSFDFVQMI
jgi:hypothetical protein